MNTPTPAMNPARLWAVRIILCVAVVVGIVTAANWVASASAGHPDSPRIFIVTPTEPTP